MPDHTTTVGLGEELGNEVGESSEILEKGGDEVDVVDKVDKVDIVGVWTRPMTSIERSLGNYGSEFPADYITSSVDSLAVVH